MLHKRTARLTSVAALGFIAAVAAVHVEPSAGGGVAGPTALVGDARSVWVADTSGRIRKLDARTRGRRYVASVGGYPHSLALGDTTLWVATLDGVNGSILRLSRDTGKHAGRPIHVGNGQPLELAVGGRTVWLVNAVDRRIWRINAHTGRIAGATTVAAQPWQSATIAADQNGAWVAYYASPAASTLVRLDRAGHVLFRRSVAHLEILALAIDRGRLFAVGGSRLLRLNATSGRATAPPIRVGRDPIALAVGPGGIWIADLGERLGLRRIDPNTGRVTAGPYRAPGRSARADALVVSGGYLWATNAYGIASQLDPSTGTSVGHPIRIP